jgi:hypothetical protein
MERVSGALSAVLGRLVGVLPERRREWGEALYAEAAAVPPGAPRVRWLVGALRVVAWQAHLTRRAGWWLAVAAAGAGTVAAGWHGGSTVPGAGVGRAFLVALVLLLAGLPLLSRRVFGPVGASRAARAARTAAYALVCALVPALVALSGYAGARFAGADGENRAQLAHDAAVASVFMLLLLGGYAAAILAMTARRSAVAPATLAAGAGAGIAAGLLAYALTPLGGRLTLGPGWLSALCYLTLIVALAAAPLAAGAVATRRTGSTGQGTVAGLWAGAAAGLVATVLTLPTMVLFPTHVNLHWANPDPEAPHGTPYELRMSVGDTAGKYLGVLILAPMLGAGLGAYGAAAARGARPTARRPAPSRA